LERDRLETPLDVERADTLRRIKLVPGNGGHRDVPGLDVDGRLPRGLNGVDVVGNTALRADRPDFRDRLYHTGLIIRGHHRDERRVGADRGRDRLGRDDAARVGRYAGDGEPIALQRVGRVSNRVV